MQIDADSKPLASFPRRREVIRCAIWHRVMGSRLRGNDTVANLRSSHVNPRQMFSHLFKLNPLLADHLAPLGGFLLLVSDEFFRRAAHGIHALGFEFVFDIVGA